VLERLTPAARMALLRGLRSFLLDVSHLEGAYQLSQNRNDADHANIIAQLEASPWAEDHAVAQDMRKTRAGQ